MTSLVQGQAAPLPFPELRSRLTLTPLSPREALATWSLRAEDWKVALEWAGPSSIHAALVLRILDVTDVHFDGFNHHGAWDVELGPGEERHRTIAVSFDGRSLAGCLGLRTPSGYFHAVVHARLCHLPREGLAPRFPSRRLRIMAQPAGPSSRRAQPRCDS